MNQPLAYFITFHTHGSWLHGRAQGSVDPEHNQPGTPVLPEDGQRHNRERAVMKKPPFVLDDDHRSCMRATIVEVCDHRQWQLLALHVRTNHVHAVIVAPCKPEKVMSDLKAWCTRRLREAKLLGQKDDAWSRHGSTLYLWREASVAEKTDYTLNQQGTPLRFAKYPDDDHPSRYA